MGLLRRVPYDEFVVRHLIRGNDSARFHRDRRKPLIDETLFHYHVGVLKSFFSVSTFEAEPVRNVVGEFVIEAGACRIHSLFRVDDGVQGFVVDFDQIGRVTRDVLVYSDHGSNRFADKAHRALGEVASTALTVAVFTIAARFFPVLALRRILWAVPLFALLIFVAIQMMFLAPGDPDYEQVDRLLQRYRAQAPLVDSLLKEMGLTGTDLTKLGNMMREPVGADGDDELK
jgi:hypothetical protein